MKRLLIPSLLSLALCAPPVQASPSYWLNVKGWDQPDWWNCDDKPGLVRVPSAYKDYMNTFVCIRPSTFIRTGGGGRVMYSERSIWTRDPELSPAVAKLIKRRSTKGDKSAQLGWMEVNCQTMEYRENMISMVMTTSPTMHRSWKQFSFQPDASFVSGKMEWSDWTPIMRMKPVQKWICAQ